VGRWGFSHKAKAFKRVVFPVIFLCFFLPAKSKTIWEGELYWVQANGVWVVRKDGALDLGWVGDKISHVQNVALAVGLGLFFSFFSLLQNRLRWDFPQLDRPDVVRILDTILDFPASVGIFTSEARNKKSVGIKRMG